jgi:hypothetical protein
LTDDPTATVATIGVLADTLTLTLALLLLLLALLLLLQVELMQGSRGQRRSQTQH